MKLSEQELLKVLNRPGYGVLDGSVFDLAPTTPICPQNAHSARRDDVGGNSVSSTQKPIRTSVRPSTAFWRNEWEFQAAVIAEARRRAILQPEYALLVAIPNGQYRKGQRAEAGLTPGMPDLVLLVQRGGYGGLFIELKCASNKPSDAQREMLYRLRMEGYRCEVVWDSVDEVMSIIDDYLRGESRCT